MSAYVVAPAEPGEVLGIVEAASGVGVVLGGAPVAVADAESEPVPVLLVVPECGEC